LSLNVVLTLSDLEEVLERTMVTPMDDISAGLVYIGKVLETQLQIIANIAERSADLDLRMTNIHVQALELAKEVRLPCPHCL
jgi:predicted DNA-binding ArsR family transcriptional regulator